MDPRSESARAVRGAVIEDLDTFNVNVSSPEGTKFVMLVKDDDGKFRCRGKEKPNPDALVTALIREMQAKNSVCKQLMEENQMFSQYFDIIRAEAASLVATVQADSVSRCIEMHPEVRKRRKTFFLSQQAETPPEDGARPTPDDKPDPTATPARKTKNAYRPKADRGFDVIVPGRKRRQVHEIERKGTSSDSEETHRPIEMTEEEQRYSRSF